jgi:hypothetical protein
MSEMVERVARAVLSALNELTSGDYSLDYVRPSGLTAAQEVARAAIEAMREPTDRIAKINGSANWSKMIDAALSPHDPTEKK